MDKKQQILFTKKGTILFLLTIPLFLTGAFALSVDEESLFSGTIGMSVTMTSAMIVGILVGLLWRYEDPRFGDSLFQRVEKN